MSELTVSGLRVVREIALSGSFTAAARLLGYSQSAISRQVGAIEAAAGHPLFIREARGARVTPAGAIVVEHAGRILASVDALGQDLAGLGDRLAGRVKLGVFPAAMAVLAPRAVALLRSEHPGLEVSLSEAATPSLLRQLRAGGWASPSSASALACTITTSPDSSTRSCSPEACGSLSRTATGWPRRASWR